MSAPTESAEARVNKLRDHAEKIRTDAAKIRQERIRASMLNIASSYDKVADSLARFLTKKIPTCRPGAGVRISAARPDCSRSPVARRSSVATSAYGPIATQARPWNLLPVLERQRKRAVV